MRYRLSFNFRNYRSTHKSTWMTKDMRELPISKMSTKHILNSLNLMARANQENLVAFKGLKEEYERRMNEEAKYGP